MKKYFPIWMKNLVKKFLLKKNRKPKVLFCPICKSKLSHFDRLDDYYFQMFDKYECNFSLFQIETINLLQYYCPKCGASDRNRLYSLFFERKFSEMIIAGTQYKILDIAPDNNLAKWLKKHSFLQYRSMDLYMANVDDHFDITDMNGYADNNFDIILCSHVLEHIKDDIRAMAEIYRILKVGGFAIVMVPILLSLNKDLENDDWTSDADRWKHFGQNDHVRMYSKKGFVEKLESCGFVVEQLGAEYFGKDVFAKHGISERSILYTVTK